MGKLNDKFLKLAYLYSNLILQSLLNKDKGLIMVNKDFWICNKPHPKASVIKKKKRKQISLPDMDSNGATARRILISGSWWRGKRSARTKSTLNSSISIFYSVLSQILLVPSITMYFDVHCFLKVVSRLFLLMLITCSLKSNSSVQKRRSPNHSCPTDSVFFPYSGQQLGQKQKEQEISCSIVKC